MWDSKSSKDYKLLYLTRLYFVVLLFALFACGLSEIYLLY